MNTTSSATTRSLPARGPAGQTIELSRAGAHGGRKRWLLRESPYRGRLGSIGLPKLVSHVLENRGVGTTNDAKTFLGGLPIKLGDPKHLPGFENALTVLRKAIHDGIPVSVYGDFDVDGITSTAILTDTIRDLGGRAMPYIPHREREGYGLNLRAIESLADRGAGVLVACDCGTTSVREIEHARGLGLDVVVVDHHLPPELLPDASAMVNPKMHDSDYGFDGYCSGGVSFRLSEALYADARRDFPEARYIELAALATVADMVPLVEENREVVRRGLIALSRTQRPGLRALMQVAGINQKSVTSESIAFQLAPRLNATGRLADARLALDLLLCEEEGPALSLAQEIDALNQERQRMTLEAQELAREIVSSYPDLPLMLVGDAGFHQGIIGLVASRLVESYGRPAVVYQQGDFESRGSCRSIGPYDITGGLRSCGELFERFGGHTQAAGFTILNDRLDSLRERLVDHAGKSLEGLDLTPVVNVDAEWPLNELRSQEIKWLGKLQPHGVGNEEATLLSRRVDVVESRTVGEGRHLRLKLRAGPVAWPAIAFGWEGDIPAEGSQVDVVYRLSADRYGPGEAGGALQLGIVDLAPAI